MAYRYFCLQTHYRKQLKFSYDSLKAAASGLERLYQKISELPDRIEGQEVTAKAKKFIEPIFEDLNTCKVLASLWTVLGDASISAGDKWSVLEISEQALGLGLLESKEKVEAKQNAAADIDPKFQKLLELRNQLRQEKKWQEADAVRDQISAAGYEIADSPEGAKLVKKNS